MRASRVVLILIGGLAVGCGGETVSAGGETSSDETTTGEELEPTACERVLDPAIYPEELVWTPPPMIGDETCPASGPSYVVDLPAPVLVTGTVTYEGNPGEGMIALYGRTNEGKAIAGVGEDGSFAVEVLPGRYDVKLSPSPSVAQLTTMMTVAEDLEIVAPTVLPIDVPVVTISGAMTMDGEPAPDEYGWLFILSGPDLWAQQMVDGNYSATATPGSYTVFYDSCNPALLNFEIGSLCYDPELPPLPDRVGPNQKHVPFMQLEIGSEDLQIDLDVPTVIVSGILTLDGESFVGGLNFDGEIPNSIAASEGAFSERWVAAHYEHVWMKGYDIDDSDHVHAELLPQLETLEADVYVDLARTSANVSAAWPGSGQLIGVPSLMTWLPGWGEWLSLEVPWAIDQTLEFSMWPGTRSTALVGKACWPDLAASSHPIAIMLGDDLEMSGEYELDVAIEDEWAAVHIDLARDKPELTADGVLRIEPIARPPDFDSGAFPASGPTLDVHGYLPRGPAVVSVFRIPIGVVDIQDGTTVFVRPTSGTLEVQLEVGGASVDIAHLISMPLGENYPDIDLDEGHVSGRYQLIYDGRVNNELVHDDGLPDNVDAVVGCITREG